jgi:hypothetical protein
MVLPPVPEPRTTPAAPATTTTTPAARLCGRAGRRGNRGSQRGHADGRADGRTHRADAPKQRNRHRCDGLSQQLARCQKTLHHSAHPSFLSPHLRFNQAACENLGWNSAATDNTQRRSDSLLLFPMHVSLGKDLRDPYLGIQAPRDAEAPRWHRLSIRMTAVFAKAKSENAGAISMNGPTAALTVR